MRPAPSAAVAGWLRGRCESHEFLNHQFLQGETNFYFLNISFYHQNYTSMLQLSTSAAWLGAPLWLGGPLWLGLPQWRGALPWPMELLGRGNFLEVAGDPNLESKKKVRTAATKCVFFLSAGFRAGHKQQNLQKHKVF